MYRIRLQELVFMTWKESKLKGEHCYIHLQWWLQQLDAKKKRSIMETYYFVLAFLEWKNKHKNPIIQLRYTLRLTKT